MLPFDERCCTEITDLNLSSTPVMVNGLDVRVHKVELLGELRGVAEDSKEWKEFFSHVRRFRQLLLGSESTSLNGNRSSRCFIRDDAGERSRLVDEARERRVCFLEEVGFYGAPDLWDEVVRLYRAIDACKGMGGAGHHFDAAGMRCGLREDTQSSGAVAKTYGNLHLGSRLV